MKSSSAIALVLGLSALSGGWSQAHAQVATTAPVVVSGAGTRLDITSSGTPIINITAPRADGTSHNVFSRLNVGQEGLILNNSQAIGQSQIGGTVLANQNLRVAGAVPARLILNEVVNGTRSDLNGAIEVFGTRAGVVIANPAGITCDGCGFINISRASLSTGRPIFDASNAFTALKVNGGSVIIQGRGLSGGDVDFFDIVTGSATINANLYARDLVVSGGAAYFDYGARTATQRDLLSGIVIDSSVLGGMYANRIRLIGSGAGVGINLRGVVSALNSGVSIATDGAITVRNVNAGGDIAIASRASSVRVEEYVSSGGSTIINAAGDIAIADNQTAVNEATITQFVPAIRRFRYFTEPSDYEDGAGTYQTYSPITLAAASIDALGSVVLQSGRDILHNNRGSISGDNVSLIANQDILLGGGSGIYANNLTLDAVRDVSLKASTNIRSSAQYTDLGRGLFQNTYLTSTEVIGAQLDSYGSLFVRAGRDVSLEAASLSADGIIGLTAARDIAIGGIASIGTTNQSWKTSRSVTGSSLETVSNYDGSRIAAGAGLFVNAAQELEITGSALQSESGLSLWATEGTAYIAGSDIAATGDLVLSGRDIVVTGSVNSSTFDETVRSVKRGFLSKRTSTSVTSNQIETIFASTLSGNRVTLDSDRQIGIFDSDIAGDSAVDITAGGNITISSIPTTSDYFSSTKVKKSGFSIGSGGLFLGVSKTSNIVDTNIVSNIGSLIGAASGAVRISAGAGLGGTSSAGDLDIVGSRIAALNAITLAGDTVDIVNNVNVNTTSTAYSTSSFGYTYGIQAPLINSVSSLARLGDIATKTSNTRTLAVSALASGLAIKNGYDAAKTTIDAIKSGNGSIGVTLSASIGYSRSTSTSLSIDQTIVASQVTGGDVSILARAGANRTGISIYGSDVAASRDVRLFSNGAIDLGAAIETDRYSGQSSSFGISLGVSAGVGFGKDFGGKGLGISPPTITLSLSSSSSRYNGVDVTSRSTIVGAGGTASVNTLGLLTIDGSQLSANRVEIDAGALNIVSRQNTSNYLSRERSLGLTLSYTLGGSFGGSLNYGGGNQTGNFASVADQAGVRAGAGGFDIRVAGLTDLKGGVIASTAAAGLNSLRTGTLRSSNISNFETYNVNNFSFGGGFGGLYLGGSGQVNPIGGTPLPSSNFGFGNFSFTLPTYLTAYGSQASATLSAISPANVVITSGEALSLSALASLSRDTSNANSALTRQFTDATRASIAQDFEAARQLVTEVSTFFANRAAEQTRAEAAAIAAGVQYEINPATGQPKLDASGKPIPKRDLITGNLIAVANSGAQQYIDIAANARDNYGSGSAARIIGTAISGAAGGNVTGSLGSFVQAAAVNALQAFATTRVKAIADSFFKRNGAGVLAPTVESEAVRTALQALVGCAGAAPTGNCASGALGASSSVVLNNLITSLLQPEERDANGNIIPRSLADQQTRTALIATLTGAIAGALGANAGVASNAGRLETENNEESTNGRVNLCDPSRSSRCASNFLGYRNAGPNTVEGSNWAQAAATAKRLLNSQDPLVIEALVRHNVYSNNSFSYDELAGLLAISGGTPTGLDLFFGTTYANSRIQLDGLSEIGFRLAQTASKDNLTFYAANPQRLSDLPPDQARNMRIALTYIAYHVVANKDVSNVSLGFRAVVDLISDSQTYTAANARQLGRGALQGVANLVLLLGNAAVQSTSPIPLPNNSFNLGVQAATGTDPNNLFGDTGSLRQDALREAGNFFTAFFPVPIRGASAVDDLVRATRGADDAARGVSAITRRSADEVNVPGVVNGFSGSYVPGTQVAEFVTVEAVQLVRVGTASGGRWYVRAQDIAGKTPEQIRQFLALRDLPTQIQIVNVPIGTNLRAGQIAAQPGFGVPVASGGVQFQNIGANLPDNAFQALRRLTPGRRLILPVPVPAPQPSPTQPR